MKILNSSFTFKRDSSPEKKKYFPFIYSPSVSTKPDAVFSICKQIIIFILVNKKKNKYKNVNLFLWCTAEFSA